MFESFNTFIVFIPMIIFFIFIFVLLLVTKEKKREITSVNEYSLVNKTKFKEFYDELIKNPEYKKFTDNKLYKFSKNYLPKIMLGLIFIPIIFSILSFTKFGSLFPFIVAPIMFVLIFTLVIITIIAGVNEGKIKNIYIEMIFKKFLNEFYPTYYFNDKMGILESEYRLKKYSSYYNRYYASNLFDFKLKDIYPVKYSELKTVHVTRNSEGKTRRTTTFQGIAGYVKLNKNVLNSDLYIGHHTSFSNVKLDDETFEKIYDVSSDNEVEVYKFLSPKFMDKLIKLDDKAEFDFLIEKDQISFRMRIGDFFDIKSTEEEVINSLVKYDSVFKLIEDTLYTLIRELEEK